MFCYRCFRWGVFCPSTCVPVVQRCKIIQILWPISTRYWQNKSFYHSHILYFDMFLHKLFRHFGGTPYTCAFVVLCNFKVYASFIPFLEFLMVVHCIIFSDPLLKILIQLEDVFSLTQCNYLSDWFWTAVWTSKLRECLSVLLLTSMLSETWNLQLNTEKSSLQIRFTYTHIYITCL